MREASLERSDESTQDRSGISQKSLVPLIGSQSMTHAKMSIMIMRIVSGIHSQSDSKKFIAEETGGTRMGFTFVELPMPTSPRS